MPAMTSQQYRKALARYNLTQGDAGWLFGGKTRTSGRRWAAEGVPFHVALILTLMDELNLSPDDIENYGAKWRKRK